MPDDDEILKRLEKRLTEEYSKAAKEMEQKLETYLKKFEKKDKIKREQLKNGEITQKEYNHWRLGQIMIGKRWKEMRDVLAQDLTNVDKIARSIINGTMPEVYALYHNYSAYELERDTLVDMSFTLYGKEYVEKIFRENSELLPPATYNTKKSKKWTQQKVQAAVTQGILRGESIPKIAKRMQNIADSSKAASVRYARTAMTGAHNAARLENYKHAESMGINLVKQWVATLDSRTRDSHRWLDGETVAVGERFSNGCRYPGDRTAAPEEFWNCRCTMKTVQEGFEYEPHRRASKLGDMSYEEWKQGHKKGGE